MALTLAMKDGKYLRGIGGKWSTSCDCCPPPGGCTSVFITVTVDLEWAAGDLDLYGAYVPHFPVGLFHGDNYFSIPTGVCKDYTLPPTDVGTHGWDNHISHWSMIPTSLLLSGGVCHPGEHGVTVVGAIVSGGGEIDGGYLGNPTNEHFTFSDTIAPGDFKKFWCWFSKIVATGATDPTRANINVRNAAGGCKLLINGSTTVLPGNSVDYTISSQGFGDKGDAAFDYLPNNALGAWTTILTFENGGA